MAMDGTALRGLCEGAEGASGRMNAAASFPNLGQPCRPCVSDGRGKMLALLLKDQINWQNNISAGIGNDRKDWRQKDNSNETKNIG